jgi:hypothetical protein
MVKLKIIALVLITGSFVISLNCFASQNPQKIPKIETQENEDALLNIEFVIDKEFDKSRIFGIFQINDPAGLSSRAQSMEIDVEIARSINQAKSYHEVKDQLDSLAKTRYDKKMDEMIEAKKEYQSLWTVMIAPFSKTITKETGHSWFYEKYTCVVSAFHPGLTDWYGNTIAAKYNHTMLSKKRIVAHELALSHIFHIVRKYYTKQDIDDWKVWAFSEISAVFVLNHHDLIEYWPQFSSNATYFSQSNYPQLVPLETELKELFEKRENFKDYLDQSVKALKAFKNTHGKKNLETDKAQ